MLGKIKRRAFLRAAAMGTGGAILAACQPQVVEKVVTKEVEKVVEKPVEKVVKETVIVQGTPNVVEKVITAAPAKVVPATLEWWFCDGAQDMMNAAEKVIIPGFQQRYPHLKVNAIYSPWGKWGEMEMTAFAAGAMADVFQPFTEVIPDLARTSRAVAMDPYVEVSKIVKKENYSDPIWAFFVQKGKLYGVPWRNDIRATQYMKSALEKSGAKPPTDFDTLVAAAKAMTKKEGDKITQAGYDPFAAPPYGPTQRFAPFLWSLGGEMLTPDGRKSAFNSDEGVAAVNFLVELHQAVWPNPEATLEQAPIPHIATGRLVMSAGGTGIAAQLAQYAPDKVADLEIVVPPVKGRGPKAATYGLAFPSPWCMSTKGKAKNPDAAWTLVEYLSEPLVAAEANKASMNAPVNKHVQALPYYANDKHWPKYLELGNKWNKNMPSWPRTFELYKSLSDLISEVWFKKKTAKDALKEAAAVWDPVLEKEGY